MVPRLIVNLEGREKEGKTHFALTAPKPLAYLNFDKSSAEDVMRKFREQQIFAKNYWPTSTDQASYQVIWEMFRRDYDALLQSDVRTIVLDTGTEIYNISRMAEFGKLTQVMPHQYARVNSVFRQLFNDAYTTEKNIVIVHKKKKEYIENDWTGKWERSGFSETGFLVQINVECRRDPQPPYDFVAQVLNCSLNGDLMGLELRNGMNSFPTLAQLAIPDSKPEDWQ
jgi:hypothetical protein